MSIVIVFIVFLVLWLLIEIFSVVLKITGLEISKARFQIISIITHTGFTTRESELISQHRIRRRIASSLMLISYISQVMLISLFVNILIENINNLVFIGIALIVLFGIVMLLTRTKMTSTKFNHLIEKLISKSIKNQSNIELNNILQISDGYGIYEIVLEESNYLCGKTLGSTQLSSLKINVLKVDRGEEVSDFPDAKFILRSGDRLVLYGKTDSITKIAISTNE